MFVLLSNGDAIYTMHGCHDGRQSYDILCCWWNICIWYREVYSADGHMIRVLKKCPRSFGRVDHLRCVGPCLSRAIAIVVVIQCNAGTALVLQCYTEIHVAFQCCLKKLTQNQFIDLFAPLIDSHRDQHHQSTPWWNAVHTLVCPAVCFIYANEKLIGNLN